MAQQESTDERLMTLELKVMDVERTVQELDAVIVRQALDIERLRVDRERLEERVASLASGIEETSTSADEVPPHY